MTRFRMVSTRGRIFSIASLPRTWEVNGQIQSDPSLFKQNHPVRNCHRFLYIMSDQKGCKPLLPPQSFNQPLHLNACQSIQRSQRFIQQKQTWPAHQSHGQCNPLALPTGQNRWPFRSIFRQPDFPKNFRCPLSLLPIASRDTESHIVDDILPGKKAWILKHDPDQRIQPRTGAPS